MARKKKKPTSRKTKKEKRSGGKSGKRASKGAQARAAEPVVESGAGTDTEIEAPAAAEATEAERPPEAPADADPAPVALEDDDVPVIDLDADASEDPIERLIAETVANALPEEVLEPAEPVVDLDRELEAEVAAEGPHADVERTGAAGSQPEDPAESEAEDHAEAETETAPDGAVLAGAAAERDAETLPRQEIAAEVARRLVDLGPVSSPEVRDRLLAEALAHAEHKDARYRIPFSAAAAVGRWKALAGTVILLIAGAVALAPPGWARPEPPARLAEEERARNLRAALLLQAQQVEAFRVRTQQLPSTLDEVAETLPGVRYVRSGNRAYQLIAYESNGAAVVYDSTNPGPAFADLTTWAAAGAMP